jgi:hypothetical protein
VLGDGGNKVCLKGGIEVVGWREGDLTRLSA